MSSSLILGHSWLPGVQFGDAEAREITGLQPNLEVFISAGMARGDYRQGDGNSERLSVQGRRYPMRRHGTVHSILGNNENGNDSKSHR